MVSHTFGFSFLPFIPGKAMQGHDGDAKVKVPTFSSFLSVAAGQKEQLPLKFAKVRKGTGFVSLSDLPSDGEEDEEALLWMLVRVWISFETSAHIWATVKTEDDKFSQEWTWDIKIWLKPEKAIGPSQKR